MTEKVLWVVNYNHIDDFVTRAVQVGATGVAIRTDNDVATAIQRFAARNIKVFAWRWPSTMRDAALKEADKVANLYQAGLDGYFVDPEGDPGKPWDWDREGLEDVADDFCTRVVAAGGNKPFGVTSHYRAKAVFPHLPWSIFFQHATVLLPQAYWRSTAGAIGHGIPADNYDRSIEFWSKAGGDADMVVPMAGELGSSKRAEIYAYAAEAEKKGIGSLHFYAYEPSVSDAVWSAVAEA